MYNPPTFMTLELLDKLLAEFEWPAPYTLEDDLPDGIVVAFPRCHLYFTEGFESTIQIRFLPEDTGTDEPLTLGHALSTIASVPPPQIPPTMHASLEKVIAGIREQCTLVLTYLRPCLLGDFSWVERYQRAH